MFKSKLINNKKYYKLRGRILFLFVIPPIVLSLIANFKMYPIWLNLTIVIVYISLIILTIIYGRKMASMIGNETIEIDNNEIRVKSKNSNQKEAIPIEKVDKIILKKSYGMPQENMVEITKEIKGNPKENFIRVHIDGDIRQYDFEFDSYYMIAQLNKVIEHWEKSGYQIERV